MLRSEPPREPQREPQSGLPREPLWGPPREPPQQPAVRNPLWMNSSSPHSSLVPLQDGDKHATAIPNPKLYTSTRWGEECHLHATAPRRFILYRFGDPCAAVQIYRSTCWDPAQVWGSVCCSAEFGDPHAGILYGVEDLSFELLAGSFFYRHGDMYAPALAGAISYRRAGKCSGTGTFTSCTTTPHTQTHNAKHMCEHALARAATHMLTLAN